MSTGASREIRMACKEILVGDSDRDHNDRPGGELLDRRQRPAHRSRSRPLASEHPLYGVEQILRDVVGRHRKQSRWYSHSPRP